MTIDINAIREALHIVTQCFWWISVLETSEDTIVAIKT